MRLYHTPRTRSTRIAWILEEIGVPYDVTVLTSDERQGAEHRRRHPLGRVPVLEDEEGVLFESLALCLHLADLSPASGLNWALGTRKRGLVYQWASFAMTELEPAVVDVLRYRDSDPRRTAAATGTFQECAGVIAEALAGRDHLVGDRFSVADLVCGAVLMFARNLGLTDGMGDVTRWLETLDARPARQRAVAIGT
jgi:glutathione S-transferase